MVKNYRFFLLGFVFVVGVLLSSGIVGADIGFSLVSSGNLVENVSLQYNLTVNNSNAGSDANISLVSVIVNSSIFGFVAETDDSDSVSNFSNSTVGDNIYLNWSNSTGYVVNGSSVNSFLFNLTGLLSGFQNINIVTVNGSGASDSWSIAVDVKSVCDGLDNSTCSITDNCALDDRFGICGPSCEEDGSTKEECDALGGYCRWEEEGEDLGCHFAPFSMQTFGCNIEDSALCDAEDNCTWEWMANSCIVDCFKFDSYNGGDNETCEDAYGGSICEWEEDWYCKDNPNDTWCVENNPGMCNPFFFSMGFDGFSPCFEFDGNKTGCTVDMSEECVWFSEPNCPVGDWCYGDGSDPGFCNPLGGFDFGSDFDCWLHDGNKDACKDAIEQSQWPCSWNADPWGPLDSGTEAGWCNMMFDGMQNGCWDYSDEEDCGSASSFGLACSWSNSTDTSSGWCEDVGCWAYYDNESCSARESDGCYWNSDYGYCEERWCGDFYSNETYCSVTSNSTYGLDCTWTNYSWGTAGDGWCEENGCWKRDWTNDTYCTAKAGCEWDSTNNWCNEKGCWDYGANETYCAGVDGLACRWQNATGGWCEQDGCWSYDGTNETACVNTSADLGMNCEWENSSGQEMCFQTMANCVDYAGDESGCYGTGYCMWNYTDNNCTAPTFGPTDFMNPGCWIFTQAGTTKCGNITTCTWNESEANCDDNGADAENGIQCADINDSQMCSSMPMLATCCSWNGTSCLEDFMSFSCWDNMQEPPVGAMFCEDYVAKYDETTCNQIAGDPWYMPCTWDDSYQECMFAGDNFFTNPDQMTFGDIGSQTNCQAIGGVWKEEQWIDSDGNPNWDSWCEIGFGFDMQFCDDVCWACEKQDDGTVWASQATAEGACTGSAAGCMFYADANAMNTYGWCDMDWTKQGNCDSNCWDCWENQQCTDSGAGCKWFTDPWNENMGWCDDQNVKTCDDDCFMCWDLANCQNSATDCKWNNDYWFCEPATSGDGGESYEVCFDGIDNDNDGFVDCGDAECMFDSFCGGSAVFGSECMQIPDEEHCVNGSEYHSTYNCTWITDKWNNSWCDMPGAQCWLSDDNETACGLEEGCNYKNMSEMGMDNSCDINFSIMDDAQCWNYGDNESYCNNETGCLWQEDMWCQENPTDAWCNESNVTNGFMPGWCDNEIWSCYQYDRNKTACNDATHCAWQEDWWCSSAEGASDPWCSENIDSAGWCSPECFTRNATMCADNVTINGISTAGVCQIFNATTSGWCEPENMFKGCWDHDGNETTCGEDDHCTWIVDPYTTIGGFCADNFMYDTIGNMDSSPPMMIASKESNGGVNATKDISGLGIKDNFETLSIGTSVNNMSEAAICNSSFGWDAGASFTGNKSTKFYWYLDSNGNDSDNCKPDDDDALGGFDLKFKYEAVLVDGSVVETKVAYKCLCSDVECKWSASQIKFNAWPDKMCYMVGGGVIAIDKADLEKLNVLGLYDKSADMRIYSTTGSETDPYDTIGPIYYTPNTADFKFEKCDGLADTDGDGFLPSEDPDCIDFLRNGFIDVEKSTECGDGIDNDGNNLTDCADLGCMYDSYYCTASDYADDFNSAPVITWVEISEFMDGAFVDIKTDKPTNATMVFYENDSFCSNVSGGAIIIQDYKLTNTLVSDDYDFWHDFSADNVTLEGQFGFATNTTYYFKVELCAKSGKCALSACTGFTTTTNVSEYFVGFTLPAPKSNVTEMLGKVDVQFDWNRNGTFDDIITGDTGFKINDSQGRDTDLKFYNPNATNSWSIEFKGVDFVGAEILNITDAFVVNTTSDNSPFIGMSGEEWQKVAGAIGIDEVEIVIPQSLTTTVGAKLMKCPDNITALTVAQGCKEVNLTDVNCTFGSASTICTVPILMGFSVFGVVEADDDSVDPPADPDSPSGGSSGGASTATPVANTTVNETADDEGVSDEGDEADSGLITDKVVDDIKSGKLGVWISIVAVIIIVAGIVFWKRKDS